MKSSKNDNISSRCCISQVYGNNTIGKNVIIKVTNTVGLITKIIEDCNGFTYEVCYPDQDNQPVKIWLNQIELSEINSEKFGFGD